MHRENLLYDECQETVPRNGKKPNGCRDGYDANQETEIKA
jgi:hypothetical protein